MSFRTSGVGLPCGAALLGLVFTLGACTADNVTIPAAADGGTVGADGTVPDTSLSVSPDGSSFDATPGNDAPVSADGGTCGAGQKLCNGQCVATDDPQYGCAGSACAPCAIAHGTAACSAGACAVGACDPGYGDCNASAADGCETNLATDHDHCGSCTNACMGSDVCFMSQCASSCGSLTDCGGSCVDPSMDPQHCGSCTRVCTAPPNGQATCSLGQCGVACNNGYTVCGNGCCANDVSDSYISGSRLKGRWVVTPDGTQQFAAWNDTQLGVDCFFQVAGDGATRCLPFGAMYVSFGEYADPACTEPLAAWSPDGACTQVPTFIQGYDYTACPSRVRLYSVGPQVSASHYYKDGTGACTPYAGGAGVSYYMEGAELAPSQYVSATTQNGPAGGGLVPVYLQGSDGSYGFAGWNDASRGQSCFFTLAGDAQNRCLPYSGAGYSGDFADPSCSVDAYEVYATACPDPAVGIKYDSTCPEYAHVVSLGARDFSSLYVSSAGTCFPTTLTPGYDFYASAGEITPSSFPAVTQSAPTGSARVQEIDWVTGGGMLEASGLYDSTRGEACSFAYAADGAVRCLPGGMFGGYYSDPQCTQQLAGWLTSFCGPTPRYMATFDTSTCPGRTHLYGLGSPVSLSVAYIPVSGVCTQVSTSGYEFFTVGAEVAPSSFQSATVVTK